MIVQAVRFAANNGTGNTLVYIAKGDINIDGITDIAVRTSVAPERPLAVFLRNKII